MQRFVPISAAAVLACAGATATAQVLAQDSADDAAYAFGWFEGTNGGSGFGPWTFANAASSGGFAGTFLATEPNDGLSNIASGASGSAWALFANSGDGLERSVAFRPISTPIDAGNVSISLGYEHGFIANGGVIGFALRNGNANADAADFAVGSRLQLFFQGGNGNYTVVDGDGVLDTGVAFGLDGLTATITLTSPDTYTLRVARFLNEEGAFQTTSFPERTLAGSGSIDSVAIFNDDGGDADPGLNNDAYFNRLAIVTGGGLDLDVDNSGTLDFLDVIAFLAQFDAVAP